MWRFVLSVSIFCLAYGQLIAGFEPYSGRWSAFCKYSAKLSSGYLLIEDTALTFISYHLPHQHGHKVHTNNEQNRLIGHVHRMAFINGKASGFTALEPASHKSNYFIGNEPALWARDVQDFRILVLNDLYPGIDLQLELKDGNLKSSFVVHPGARASQIALRYSGITDAGLSAAGSFSYQTDMGRYTETAPVSWLETESGKQFIESSFLWDEHQSVLKFNVKQSSGGKKLIIDPTLVFSSYTGATADNWGFTAAPDESGHLYAGGIVFDFRSAYQPGTGTGSYPLVGPFQSAFGGGNFDISISKFSPDGRNLIYSTYLGGNGDDYPHSLIVNRQNELILMGSTTSSNYPLSSNAYDASYNGLSDLVVSKLNASGNALIGSTYLGGSDDDGQNISAGLEANYGDNVRGEIIIGNDGSLILGSSTYSADFPVTGSGVQPLKRGGQEGCLAGLSPDLDSLYWSTFFGGDGEDAVYSVKQNRAGEIYLCGGSTSSNILRSATGYLSSAQGGVDGFLVQLNSNGSSYLHGTYLGTPSYDQAYFVDLDPQEDVYVVGQTGGQYPFSTAVFAVPGSGQFIHQFNPDLNISRMSTVFGSGSNQINISPTAFMVDSCYNIYVSGWGGNTNQFFNPLMGTTQNLPITAGAFQTVTDGSDLYFIVLNAGASGLLYATYFGGNAPVGEHVDGGTCRFSKGGTIYSAVCSGCGGNSLFPTTPGVWSNTNASLNCNLSGLKMDLNITSVRIDSIDASPNFSGCVPLTVQFVPQTANAMNYFWDFGNGDTSTAPNPIYTYLDTGVYRVRLLAVDSNSCNFSDTAYTTVVVRDDSIRADFTPSLRSNCLLREISASAPSFSPSSRFEWDFGDGSQSRNDSVMHQYSGPGRYLLSLKIIDSAACNVLDVRDTLIEILPVLEASLASSDSSLCIPASVSLSANSSQAGLFSWDFGDGSQLDTTATQLSHVFLNPGIYQIRFIVRDSLTCNLSDTGSVLFTARNDSLNTNFSPSVFTDCNNLSFSAQSPLNLAGTSYEWQFGDGNSSSGISANHIYNVPGNFSVSLLASNPLACNSPDSFSVPVRLAPPLQVDIQFPDTGGCAPFLIGLSASGGAVSTLFNWESGNGNFLSGNHLTFTYPIPGTYRLRLLATDTTFCNSISADSVLINIPADSLNTDFRPGMEINCVNRTIRAFAPPNLAGTTVRWLCGDGSVYTSDTLFHTYATAGTYVVELQLFNPLSCAVRDTGSYPVTILPFRNTAADFGDRLGCIPLVLNFRDSATAPAIYSWDFGDGNQASGNPVSHTYQNIGLYNGSLILTDSLSCNLRDTFLFQVQAVADSVNAGFNPGLNRYGCDSMVLNAIADYPGASRYRWQLGNLTSSGPQFNFSTSTPGRYRLYLEVEDSSRLCLPLARDSFDFTLDLFSSYARISDTIGCVPFSFSFASGSNQDSGVNFSWYENGILLSNDSSGNTTLRQPGTYTVQAIISDTALCFETDTFNFNLLVKNDSVEAILDTAVLDYCPPYRLAFRANGTGTQTLWYTDQGDSGSSRTDTLEFTQAGIYRIHLIETDSSRCYVSDTSSKSVRFLPLLEPTLMVDSNACSGDLIEFRAEPGSPAAAYFWTLDGIEISRAQAGSISLTAGSFVLALQLIDSQSCNIELNRSVAINILNQPVAYFTLPSDTLGYGEIMQAVQQSSGNNNWQWITTQGIFSEDSIINLPANVIGQNTLCLIAGNSDICFDTLCATYEVTFRSLIGVPNAFSPNGDGVNDIVYVEGEGIKTMNWRIFNRWGELVFQSLDQKTGWDGNWRGSLQDMDTYSWDLSVILVNNRAIRMNGNLTLLR
jgi:gliding motility-associated-like protein